jgi:cytochrome b involved in lipid metabolism
MKHYFTAIAVLCSTFTLALLIAGSISKSNQRTREAFESQLRDEVQIMTKTMEEASQQIESLSMENSALQAQLEEQAKKPTQSTASKKTATKSTPTPVTQPKPTPTPTQSGTVLTMNLVATHASESDCWIVVSNKVYSVGSYIAMHPGGRSAISRQCGKDATTAFTTRGGTGKHSSSAYTMLGTYLIGGIGSTIKL